MDNNNNRTVFAKNLTYYVERSGKTKKEIAEVVGVAASTFNDWTKGKKYPRMDKVERLAEYFGILKSDLIEERTQEHREMQKENDIISDVVLRMRTDKDFLSVVKAVNELEPEKLSSLLAFLK